MATKAGDRWIALRELREGAEPTYERLGAASGRNADAIRRRAAKEGWSETAELLSEEERQGKLQRLRNWGIRQLEAIKQRAEEGTPIDKAEIEQVSAWVRAVEKFGEGTRSGASAKENQIKRDAKMAGILKRIDQRIIELAGEYAKQLVAGKSKS